MESSKKIQSMRNQKRVHFLYNLILYSLTSLITLFVFSYTFWFPSIYRVVSSIQCNISLFINAKVFFIVGNLIVLFLVRESKLSRSQNNTSPATLDFYDEYASITNPKTVCNFYKKRDDEEKESNKKIAPGIERKKKNENEENIWEIEKKKGNTMRKSKSKSNLHTKHQENKLGLRVSKSEIWSHNEDKTVEITATKPKEEQLCISTEDLNQRVEAFIARVNKQRLLES